MSASINKFIVTMITIYYLQSLMIIIDLSRGNLRQSLSVFACKFSLHIFGRLLRNTNSPNTALFHIHALKTNVVCGNIHLEQDTSLLIPIYTMNSFVHNHFVHKTYLKTISSTIFVNLGRPALIGWNYHVGSHARLWLVKDYTRIRQCDVLGISYR